MINSKHEIRSNEFKNHNKYESIELPNQKAIMVDICKNLVIGCV